VQDLGRPGYAHLGVSASGAADALSLRAGNLLVGNADNAAALEMTLAGGTFEFESAAVVALTGADFDAGIPLWRSTAVNPGGQVRCGHARSGARCYLCVRGGIAVPLLQGSASTHLLTGLGGLEGRALKRGDVLTVGSAGASVPLGTAAPPRPHPTIRVTALGDCLPLCEPTWQVAENSNRMGLRLRGPALASNPGRMLTEGVPLGAVQVPPDGQPIILLWNTRPPGATRKSRT
jgi:biotin-dependent carboxylase-like uncharacterized protein